MYQKNFLIRKLSYLTVLSYLLVACAAVQVNTGQYPPLIKAAEQGDIAKAEELLKQGALINQTTIGNQTALHLAATTGQDEMVKWLLCYR